MEKFTAFLKKMAGRADYLLHHIVAAYILMLAFSVLVHILHWGWALLFSSCMAICALIVKEVYDYFHSRCHNAEREDMHAGILAVLIIDILLIITFGFT